MIVLVSENIGAEPKKALTKENPMKNVLYKVKTRKEFREWLAENHAIETECWTLTTGRFPSLNSTFCYLDMVEEALCFGWIDNVIKRLKTSEIVQRVSPRKKNSPWSELNKERCRRLEKIGLMTPAGRAVLPDLSTESFVVDAELSEELKKKRTGLG